MLRKPKPVPDARLWNQVVAQLQLARGHNQLRGRQTLLPRQGEVRLAVEPRHPVWAGLTLSLTVGATPADSYFQVAGERRMLADYPSAEAWLQDAIETCRGNTPYVRTHANRVSYK